MKTRSQAERQPKLPAEANPEMVKLKQQDLKRAEQKLKTVRRKMVAKRSTRSTTTDKMVYKGSKRLAKR